MKKAVLSAVAAVVVVTLFAITALMTMIAGNEKAAAEDRDDPCDPALAGDPVQQGKARLPFVGTARVTQNYGWRHQPGPIGHGKYSLHAGIDFAGPSEQQIVSALGGRVKSVQYSNPTGGNIVVVASGSGVETWYLHLRNGSIPVKVGDPVWPGRVVGVQGSTGNSTGDHLHFEVHEGGKKIDPRPWMKKHGATIPTVGSSAQGPPAVSTAPPSSSTGSSTQSVSSTTRASSSTSRTASSTSTHASSPSAGGFALPKPDPKGPFQHWKTKKPIPIPAHVKRWYVAAGQQYGIPWQLLAGIGMEETWHGTYEGYEKPNEFGAGGMMAWIKKYFAEFAAPSHPDWSSDEDQVYATANSFAKRDAKKGPAQLKRAIWLYNHADWYVNDVLAYANYYAGKGGAEVGGGGCDATSSTAYGQRAVTKARSYLGTPYVLGGGTWTGPTSGGLDCSGLVMAVVYHATGGRLKLQHKAKSNLTNPDLATVATYDGGGSAMDPQMLSSMKPGDLIVMDTGFGPWGHIAVYIGGGKVIHAPRPGGQVEVKPLTWFAKFKWVTRRPLDRYTGGGKAVTSPSATSTATGASS